MNANKQDAGGLPEMPEPLWRDTSGLGPGLFTADQMRAYGELCRAAPAGGDVECFVREMRTSKGSEFFVVVKRDGRELTPHMYTERWKAEYDVASWQHLLCGAPKPDILAYGPSAPFDRAPAGSGEVEELVHEWRAHAAKDHIPVPVAAAFDACANLLEAALLRKLQQGAGEGLASCSRCGHPGDAPADYVLVPREPTRKILRAAQKSVSGHRQETLAKMYRAMIAASQDQEGGTNG